MNQSFATLAARTNAEPDAVNELSGQVKARNSWMKNASLGEAFSTFIMRWVRVDFALHWIDLSVGQRGAVMLAI